MGNRQYEKRRQVLKLNEEQKISLEDLYSHLNQEKEYLRHRKENTKWFYILTAVMVLIYYLDGFGNEKYETVVYVISAIWLMALLFMKEHFWDHENLKFTREAIARNYKVLAKYGTYAFLNDDTNGLTVTQKDDDTFYDFQKLLDKDEPSPEQTQKFLDELGRKIKQDDKVDNPSTLSYPITLADDVEPKYLGGNIVALANSKGGGEEVVFWSGADKTWLEGDISVGDVLSANPASAARLLDEGVTSRIKDDKVDDPTNVVKFNKADKKTGYIIYYQEIQTSKKLLKPEIKILKSDMTKLRQTLINKQLGELIKLYPLEYFNKFRFYLKTQSIPFITRLPFEKHEGRMVMDFKPDGSSHNYYEDKNGELSEVTEEQLDWRTYSGNIGKKKVKLKIVK